MKKLNVIQKALKVMEAEFKLPGDKMNQSQQIKDFCRLQLGLEKDEIFGVLFFNSRFELLSFEKLFRGTITQANIYPRAILRRVLELNACSIILTHNHPSGHVTPSPADIEITKHIAKAVNYIDCKVADHVIVSATDSMSFKEKGMIR